jgi:hypothetical protein
MDSVGKKVFRSGEVVPVSGVYLTLHSTPHCSPQKTSSGRNCTNPGAQF